jgi:hypothetical protein
MFEEVYEKGDGGDEQHKKQAETAEQFEEEIAACVFVLRR